jgi:hypothetical protein
MRELPWFNPHNNSKNKGRRKPNSTAGKEKTAKCKRSPIKNLLVASRSWKQASLVDFYERWTQVFNKE